ncbi:hypothetical protein [Streptomyces sp. WAC 04229]|uniref:hypothetical protein n=1 Tax=Streptomyces sp. WAC 04229 TaxID=2203206 RepID=UPI000F736E38|nr:hypothetical protein [Streptomyces sp. WAC 04229]
MLKLAHEILWPFIEPVHGLGEMLDTKAQLICTAALGGRNRASFLPRAERGGREPGYGCGAAVTRLPQGVHDPAVNSLSDSGKWVTDFHVP